MEIYFIIFLLLVSIILTVFIIFQYIKHNRKRLEWERITEEKCRKIKSENNEYIRQTLDYISDNPYDYQNRTEHEILKDIILALATYGRRIDRIDNKLDGIYNYKTYIDSMNEQTNRIAEHFVSLNNKTAELENIFSVCRGTLQNTSNEIRTLTRHFSDTSKLETTIKECVNHLLEYSPLIHSLSQQVKYILNEMNQTVSELENSPLQRLKNIENSSQIINQMLKEIFSNIKTMYSEIVDISTDINELSSDISQIDSNISNVTSAFDQSGYDNIYSKITAIKSTLSEFRSSLDTIESAVDEYNSYNSIYSKIEEIKDLISN